MKYSLFVVLFFISGLIYSQATPQWLFPIWFEDANGDRDTVYVGYDPSANMLGYDDEFEDYDWIDTTQFNAVVFYGDPSPFTGIYNLDSAKKQEVTSYIYPDIVISFINGQMPIIMYWQNDLFYNTGLPYPDQSPYPSGIAEIECSASEPGYVNCPSAFDDDPLIMTDQPNIYYTYPITSPHLFDGSGNPPNFDEPQEVLSPFVVRIKPYLIYTYISVADLIRIKIFPNPFTNYISFQADNVISLINIYNTLGQQIKSVSSINSHSISLPTEDMQKGIYYLEITTQKKKFTSFIIKQ